MYRTRVLIASARMRIGDAQYVQRARSCLYKLWLNKLGCHSCTHNDAVSVVPVPGALVVHGVRSGPLTPQEIVPASSTSWIA